MTRIVLTALLVLGEGAMAQTIGGNTSPNQPGPTTFQTSTQLVI